MPTKCESGNYGILPKFQYQFNNIVQRCSKAMQLWECLSTPVQTSLISFAAGVLDRCQFQPGIHVAMLSTWLMCPPLHYSAE